MATATLLFVQTAALAKPKWHRVSANEVTLLTNLKEREAIERTREFSGFVTSLRKYAGSMPTHQVPLTIVVFDFDYDFDAYRPLGEDGKKQRVGGFFAERESWAIIGLSVASRSETTHRIYHEATHWFFRNPEDPMPAWIEEGLAETFSTFEVVGDEARWGGTLKESVLRLRHDGLLPLRKLISTGRANLFNGQQNSTALFYAESWLFFHYLTFGKHGIPAGAARRYAELIKTAPDYDTAFLQAFGCSMEEMDRRLAKYLNEGEYYRTRTPLGVQPTPKIEPVSAQELDEALGRLALCARRLDLAARHGQAMIERSADDPRGHALLGRVLLDKKDSEGASREFELAAKFGTTEFEPYFALGYGHHGSGDVVDGISGDDARIAADYYERAINIQPSAEIAYTNLAALVGAVEPVRDADRRTLEDGARRFPSNTMIRVGLAYLDYQKGHKDGAREALRKILAEDAPQTGARRFAERIIEAWNDEALFDRLRGLAEARKYTDAIETIQARLKSAASPQLRIQLTSLEREMKGEALRLNLNDALSKQDRDGALAAIAAILDSDAPPQLKAQANRIKAELGN